MPEDTDQARFLKEYLLGQASRHARESFEAKYLADDDLFENLIAAENDLIDSFVRGALSSAEQAQFRTHFLNTPERRERVAFARSLMDYASSKLASTPERTPQETAPRAARSSFFHSPRWAIAAAILLVAALGVFGWNLQLYRQLREASSRQQELQQQMLALTARLNSAPWQAPPLGQTLVAATFSPNVTRGAARPNVLYLPPGVSDAVVILSRKPAAYSSYKVTAEDAEGRQVWNGSNLVSNTSHEATLITVKLPPALMRAGDYIFKLSGFTQDSKIDDLDEYTIRILLR
jgi:hypothetical protein